MRCTRVKEGSSFGEEVWGPYKNRKSKRGRELKQKQTGGRGPCTHVMNNFGFELPRHGLDVTRLHKRYTVPGFSDLVFFNSEHFFFFF